MEQDKLISRAKLAHEQQRFNPDMVILADVNAQPSHISKPLMQRIEYFSSLGRPKAYSRYLRETIKPCLERLEHVRDSQLLAASGVWVACLLTWAVIPVALAALIKNGPLWQELRASLLKTITRREKSWHKTTVGEVVKEIAARHKLKMALGKDLSDKPVEHIDQTNESDGSFLMRLARQYGAIASVKNGNLLFIRQGQGKSATGKPLPVITITRKDGDSHRFTLADRGAYTGVIASWLHTREPAKKESTTVKRKRRTKKQKKEPEAKQGDYLVGTDENVLVLNRTYANRSNAERAAKMQWERLQRGVASFSLQLAEGRADLYTEMPVKVSGFKQPIDDAEWTITTLTHTVSPDNGFTTSIELEVKIDDLEME